MNTEARENRKKDTADIPRGSARRKAESNPGSAHMGVRDSPGSATTGILPGWKPVRTKSG